MHYFTSLVSITLLLLALGLSTDTVFKNAEKILQALDASFLLQKFYPRQRIGLTRITSQQTASQPRLVHRPANSNAPNSTGLNSIGPNSIGNAGRSLPLAA
jgi:hypothetical protein